MAVVIGSASIRITAEGDGLGRDVSRELNEALAGIKVDLPALDQIGARARRAELDIVKARQEVNRLERETAAAERELAAERASDVVDARAVADAELKVARNRAELAVATDRMQEATHRLSTERARERLVIERQSRALHDQTRATEEHTGTLRRLREQIRGLDIDMSRVGSTVVRGLTFGLNAALRGTTTTVGGLNRGLLGLTKAAGASQVALAGLAGTSGVLGLAAALEQAAGAALAIPGALLGAGLAVTTLVVGFQGLGQTFKDISDPAKFAQDLKQLSPQARAFATEVHKLVPEFRALRLDVQDRLFAGFGGTVRDLAHDLLPSLRLGLDDIATGLNRAALQTAKFFAQRQTVGDIQTVFGNTARSVNILTLATQPLLEALRDIGTVATGFLPGLSQGLAVGAVKLRDFVQQARDSGQLADLIGTGLERVRDLLGTVGNIGSIIGGALQAADRAGLDFLGTAHQITGELAGWAHSVQGQAFFGTLLVDAHQAALALAPLLGSIVRLVTLVSPILADIAATTGPGLKAVLDGIGDALKIASPGIHALFEGFNEFLVAIAPAIPDIGNLAKAIGTTLGSVLARIGPSMSKFLSQVSDALTRLFNDPRFAVALSNLIDGFTEFGTALITYLAPVLPDVVQLFADFAKLSAENLVPVLPDIVQGIVALGQVFQLLTPILRVVGPLISAVAFGLETIRDVVKSPGRAFDEAFEALTGISLNFGKLEGGVHNVAETLGTDFARIGQDLQGNLNLWPGWAATVDLFTGKAIGSVAGFQTATERSFVRAASAVDLGLRRISELLHPATQAIGQAGNAAFGAFSGAAALGMAGAESVVRRSMAKISGQLHVDFGPAGYGLGASFAGGITVGLLRAEAAARQAMIRIANFFPHSPAKEGPFSGTGWTPYRGKTLMDGFAAGILASVPTLTAATNRALVAGVQLPGTDGAALPTFVPTAAPSSEDGVAVPATRDDLAALLRAITKIQVVVSSKELTSKVNAVNKDNSGR